MSVFLYITCLPPSTRCLPPLCLPPVYQRPKTQRLNGPLGVNIGTRRLSQQRARLGHAEDCRVPLLGDAGLGNTDYIITGVQGRQPRR